MSETIEKTPDSLDRERRAQNAFRISIATGIIFTLIVAGVMIINRSVRLDFSLLLVLSTAVAAFFSAWLSRREKSDAGILLIIAGLLVTIIGRVFVQKGLAFPTGITNVILISTIAIYTLPNKWIGRVVAASFTTTLATIIIDQYTVGIPGSSLPAAGIGISLLLGIVYLLFLLRQFPKFNLRTKLIMGFLFLSVVPLIVLGWQTYTTSKAILEEQIKSDLRESANSTSKNFEDYINEQVNNLSTEASLPDIVDYMAAPEVERNNTPLEKSALNTLKVFSNKNNEFIISYSLIDKNGLNVLDTIPTNVNARYRDQLFFSEPVRTQKPYISNVLFPQKFNDPIVYFAIPIIDANNQTIGVLLATYDAKFLQSTLQAAVTNRLSKAEYTILIDSAHFINLGHSSRPDLLYKSYLNMDDATLLDLQKKNILKQGSRETLIMPQAEIVKALQGVVQTSFQAPSLENNGELAESAASRISVTPWVVVASQPVSSITTLTQSQTRATVTTSIAIIIASTIIALFASNFFTSPILQLTQVAEKISAGDFTQKANIKLTDEVGILGITLNKMAGEIQELIGTLEKRVADRTTELENATQQSEKRARELQAIADISRHISTEKDVEKLLQLITHEVSEQFGFYHVGIFLLNENKKFALLRAANSAGGQVMLKRQHKLEVGQTGIVGNVTATGTPRIALDTGADATYFNNPDLPETHSEMALPLFVRGEIVGALDVQSMERNAFTPSDIFHLSLLADQIAIAIDNARLIEETKKALAESQSVFQEYLADAWQSKSASNVMGYYQTVTGGSVLTKNTLTEADALGDDKDILAIPIRLRGQAIGTLNVLLGKEREELTADQVNVVKSIVERLGLALENARLFEETSTRASRERLVTDITTKIRGTNNPQEMIKTAMEELKRALGASRVEVVPKKAISLQDK